MVEIELDDDYVIFKIKNDSVNDLKRLYTIDYFEFIGLMPEIYINPKYSQTFKGGYFQDINRVSVPYRYFVDFAESVLNVSIENVKTPEDKKTTNKVSDNLFNFRPTKD
jgi:hypothetical protein